jgi:hypothetical protein
LRRSRSPGLGERHFGVSFRCPAEDRICHLSLPKCTASQNRCRIHNMERSTHSRSNATRDGCIEVSVPWVLGGCVAWLLQRTKLYKYRLGSAGFDQSEPYVVESMTEVVSAIVSRLEPSYLFPRFSDHLSRQCRGIYGMRHCRKVHRHL